MEETFRESDGLASKMHRFLLPMFHFGWFNKSVPLTIYSGVSHPGCNLLPRVGSHV